MVVFVVVVVCFVLATIKRTGKKQQQQNFNYNVSASKQKPKQQQVRCLQVFDALLFLATSTLKMFSEVSYACCSFVLM